MKNDYYSYVQELRSKGQIPHSKLVRDSSWGFILTIDNKAKIRFDSHVNKCFIYRCVAPDRYNRNCDSFLHTSSVQELTNAIQNVLEYPKISVTTFAPYKFNERDARPFKSYYVCWSQPNLMTWAELKLVALYNGRIIEDPKEFNNPMYTDFWYLVNFITKNCNSGHLLFDGKESFYPLDHRKISTSFGSYHIKPKDLTLADLEILKQMVSVL